MSMKQYYTTEQYFKNRIRNIGRQMAFKAENREDFLKWKNEVRSKLKQVTGMNSMLMCELNAVTEESVQLDGYTRKKIIIQTEPEIYMPFYMLIPDCIRQGEKRPAVITPHGHDSGGKLMTAGLKEIPGIDHAIDTYNGDYGVQFVKEGFIVFCPDARGFGERREKDRQGDEVEKLLDEECAACSGINRLAIALGQSVIGMWVWDLMRLIDYIYTCKECDAERIGCAGLSGGGSQTLWLAALDDRIKACAVSGYFYGFDEAMLEMVECSCNYAPHVWEIVDMGDLGALVAPRTMVIETGNMDKLNGKSNLANVHPQIETARQAYKLFNAEANLTHDVFNGGHLWHGTVSVPILKKEFNLK